MGYLMPDTFFKELHLYHLYFYVPESDLESVKDALFAAGAGAIGDYERCAWQTKGEGQFCPQSGANPHVGQIDQLERVAEYKVEMVFSEQLLDQVIVALKATHPYEEPAFGVIRLVS